MSKTVKIKKGLNIPMKGEAGNFFDQVEPSSLYAVKPIDFKNLTPKMVVKVGDKVKVGSVLFFDKYTPEVKFVSPVSGEVKAVNRGERRKILEVVVESDGKDEKQEFGKKNPDKVSREELKETLLKSGLWPLIHQRPYDLIAKPGDTPRYIYVSCFDTAPLAPDYDFIINGQEEDFQNGINVLKKLTDGKVYLGLNGDSASKSFSNIKNVEVNRFSGPHPAGNPGIQINQIDPINKGDVVWTVNPQDVITLGRSTSKGYFDAAKIIVLVGSEVKKPAYYRFTYGASISELLSGKIIEDKKLRIISGNVLTGSKIPDDGYLGFSDNMITVIPEGDEYEMLGWAKPGFDKFSASRTFFSWFRPNKKYDFNANLHGGERAFVISGEYNRVLPMDILPEQLIKAIMVEDIDEMEQLGIYEVIEEDMALCEFVCTSKIKVQEILRNGMNVMIREFS